MKRKNRRQNSSPVPRPNLLPSLTPLPTLQINRQREPRIWTIFQAAPIGIGVADMDRRIVETNATFQRMLGYTANELRGMTIDEVTFEDDLGYNRLLFEELVKGSCDTYRLEKRYRRKNGQLLWGRVTVSHTRMAERGSSYAVAMIEDITEMKEAEEALRKSDELFKEAQRMEAVGRFTSGIAHDFNNLLTGILGFSGLIKNRMSPRDPLMTYVKEISKAAERGALLTDQLMAIGRRKTPCPVILDLNEIIGGLDGLLRRIVDEDIDLSIELADSLGFIRADPPQMEQVILNLMANAKDAISQGGTVKIQTSNVLIDGRSTNSPLELKPGGYVVLEISDNGIGMDSSTLSKIFEPFYTTKGTELGTGLGLFTVYRIVKSCGGHIEVRSEPGSGATFKIFLPRVSGKIRKPRAKDVASDTLSGRETVLVVEDDENVRQPACEVLLTKGYKVLSAEDGEQAIRIAQAYQKPIDLLITDIIMPNVSGPDLAYQLLRKRPDLKVVFISGYAKKAIEQMKVHDPKVPFVVKPFSPNTLLQKIREVLDHSANGVDAFYKSSNRFLSLKRAVASSTGRGRLKR